MRDIALRFNGVDHGQLSYPGEQLKSVLAFKRQLQQERQIMYLDYDNLNSFKDYLRTLLSTWSREHVRGAEKKPQKFISLDNTSGLIVEAKRLRDKGNLVDAESMFARAAARGDDLNALLEYGLFFQQCGRLVWCLKSNLN